MPRASRDQQNLDITELLNHPEGAPFERILTSGEVTDFVILANSNTPNYSRLWCAFETFKARMQGIGNIGISGEPLQLLTGESPCSCSLRGEYEAAHREFESEQALIEKDLDEQLQHPELLGAASSVQTSVEQQHRQLQGYRAAAERVARAKLEVLAASKKDLIDLKNATCFSPADERAIREAIAGHEDEITTLVVSLIQKAVCGIKVNAEAQQVAPGSLQLSLVERVIDVSALPSFESALILLQFATWLLLSPKVEQLIMSGSQLACCSVYLRIALENRFLQALQTIELKEEVPSGLKWVEVAHLTLGQQQNSIELVNDALCEALRTKTEFTQAEWDGFQVVNPLSAATFVTVADQQFQPAPGPAVVEELKQLVELVALTQAEAERSRKRSLSLRWRGDIQRSNSGVLARRA